MAHNRKRCRVDESEVDPTFQEIFSFLVQNDYQKFIDNFSEVDKYIKDELYETINGHNPQKKLNVSNTDADELNLVEELFTVNSSFSLAEWRSFRVELRRNRPRSSRYVKAVISARITYSHELDQGASVRAHADPGIDQLLDFQAVLKKFLFLYHY